LVETSYDNQYSPLSPAFDLEKQNCADWIYHQNGGQVIISNANEEEPFAIDLARNLRHVWVAVTLHEIDILKELALDADYWLRVVRHAVALLIKVLN
jgi:hypothetical protein